MTSKLFEIRDKGTFIPALAIRLDPVCEDDRRLLQRAGFGDEWEDQRKYVLLMNVDGGDGPARSDPYEWSGSRTMHVAHLYIQDHFAELESGAVVDVQFLKGETAAPKQSEFAA